MPTWNSITQEIMQNNNDFDGVRRRLIRELSEYTGRNTIIYVSDFLEPDKGKPLGGVSVDLSDKTSFQEVIENLTGNAIDVLIESPGGSPEAAESIVNLLRGKFSDIRFIIPNVAKSAATMLALSGNCILMDDKSELGPTDPQLIFKKDGNSIMAPAQAILDQFKIANIEITKNPSCLPAWIPILNHYGPSLLKECENAIDLTKKLVETWLSKYMFNGEADGPQKAESIARLFANNNVHLSHKKMIGIEDAKQLGVKVYDMREDRELQKKVWNLYQAINITFNGTGAVKILENQLGDAFIKIAQPMHIPIPMNAPAGQAPVPIQTQPNQAPLNRNQRRQIEREKGKK